MNEPSKLNDFLQKNFVGNLEAYFRVSSKLKLGTVGEEWAAKNLCAPKSRPNMGETDVSGQVKAGERRFNVLACLHD